jgi:hypothetical protein
MKNILYLPIIVIAILLYPNLHLSLQIIGAIILFNKISFLKFATFVGVSVLLYTLTRTYQTAVKDGSDKKIVFVWKIISNISFYLSVVYTGYIYYLIFT